MPFLILLAAYLLTGCIVARVYHYIYFTRTIKGVSKETLNSESFKESVRAYRFMYNLNIFAWPLAIVTMCNELGPSNDN